MASEPLDLPALAREVAQAGHDPCIHVEAAVLAALRKVRDAEREACAKVAASMATALGGDGHRIAAAIRARGERT